MYMNQRNLLFGDYQRKRTIFGVAFPHLWSGRWIDAFEGIQDAAVKYDVDLLFFQGIHFSKEFDGSKIREIVQKSGTQLVELIDETTIDALIVCSGTFLYQFERQRLLNACKRFNSVPWLNIGPAIRETASVLIDNTGGIRQIMEHLLLVHNCKRIAFIRGAVEHYDSSRRFDAYLEVLTDYSLEIKPELISPPGNWSAAWAAETALKMYEKNHGAIDAFLCSNDHQAKEIINIFSKHGIPVPSTIAVCGFNNDLVAKSCIPPLTTAGTPLYERGWKSVEYLCCNDHHVPHGDILVETSLVIRQSCGCRTAGARALQERMRSNASDNEVVDEKTIYTQVHDVLGEKIGNDYCFADTCTTMFLNALKHGFKQSFQHEFSALIYKAADAGISIDKWHWVINVFYSYSLKTLQGDYRQHVLATLDQSRLIIIETIENYQRLVIIDTGKQNMVVDSFCQALRRAGDYNTLFSLLDMMLPKMNVIQCSISLYSDDLCNARQIYQFKGATRVQVNSAPYPVASIVPQKMDRTGVCRFIIEPLIYNKEPIGFALVEFGSGSCIFFEHFPSLLSTALWNCMILKKEKETGAALVQQKLLLEESNEILIAQAHQCEFAYSQLKMDQERLTQQEQMGSLGRLTAGIAHEMNTPLATVRAALSEVKKLADEFRISIDDKDVTNEDFCQITNEMCDAIMLAKKAFDQAESFVKSISAQTDTPDDVTLQIFDVVNVVNNVITFLSHTIRKSNCTISLQSRDKTVMVRGAPGRLIQVITNLMTNALDAMANVKNPKIEINVWSETEHAYISVKDNGCGIPKDHKTRIFDPLFTTKPFGQGTGLGLSIVHEIIHKDFNGTVKVDSIPDEGSTFTIELKRNL
jgi:signal transduction histidine kinase/DNA-binding LacI/PurR family transcriptional regulator